MTRRGRTRRRRCDEIERDEAQAEASNVSLLDIMRRLRLSDEADARRILAMTQREVQEASETRFEELNDWTELFARAGKSARGQGVSARSQAAASFVAALEMASSWEVEIRQDRAFGVVKVGKK